MSKSRKLRGRFLSPTGVRSSPMRQLTTHPLAAYDEERRLEQQRVADACTIRDEPEVVGPAILDSYAESNAFRYAQQHMADVLEAQQRRPLLRAEDRLKDVRRRAKYAHVDLSHEIHIMRRDLEKARAKGQEPKERTLAKLTGVESLLDGIAA